MEQHLASSSHSTQASEIDDILHLVLALWLTVSAVNAIAAIRSIQKRAEIWLSV